MSDRSIERQVYSAELKYIPFSNIELVWIQMEKLGGHAIANCCCIPSILQNYINSFQDRTFPKLRILNICD